MKIKNTGYNYGKSEICDTPMQEKYIKQDFWVRGEPVIVEEVPAGVCLKCGEKVVKVDVGRWIAKAPRISVPAINLVA